MNPSFRPYYGSDGADRLNPSDFAFTNWTDLFMRGGDDTVVALDNIQALKIYAGDGNDNISGSSSYDFITGDNGNDILNGKAGNDTLVGGTGNDTLIGGEGEFWDYLTGGAGRDKLTGGLGNDQFAFDTALDATTNVDNITDFSNVSRNDDIILLENAIFTKLTKTGTLDASQFKDVTGGGVKLDANDHILYNRDKGALYYDADGSGTAAKAVAFAVLDTKPALTFQDFQIV